MISRFKFNGLAKEARPRHYFGALGLVDVDDEALASCRSTGEQQSLSESEAEEEIEEINTLIPTNVLHLIPDASPAAELPGSPHSSSSYADEEFYDPNGEPTALSNQTAAVDATNVRAGRPELAVQHDASSAPAACATTSHGILLRQEQERTIHDRIDCLRAGSGTAGLGSAVLPTVTPASARADVMPRATPQMMGSAGQSPAATALPPSAVPLELAQQPALPAGAAAAAATARAAAGGSRAQAAGAVAAQAAGAAAGLAAVAGDAVAVDPSVEEEVEELLAACGGRMGMVLCEVPPLLCVSPPPSSLPLLFLDELPPACQPPLPPRPFCLPYQHRTPYPLNCVVGLGLCRISDGHWRTMGSTHPR